MTKYLNEYDELDNVIREYGKVIEETFGDASNLGIAFSPSIEEVVDKRTTLTSKLDYSTGVATYHVTVYQDFSIEKPQMLTDCSLCEMTIQDKVFSFLKIITPFTRIQVLDFIIARTDEIEEILKEASKRLSVKNFEKFEAPLIGLDEISKELKENTVDFLLDEKLREFCISRNIPLKRGVLLHGKAGVGKTTSIKMLKELAIQNNIEFTSFSSANKFMESTDQFYNRNAKHIFIFEDFESLLQDRSESVGNSNSVMQVIFNTLDGVDQIRDVVCVFTTNLIGNLDPAFLRTGRIDKVIEFQLPSKDQTIKFLEAYIPEYAELTSHVLKKLTDSTKDISYALLKGICDNINLKDFHSTRKSIMDWVQVERIIEEELKKSTKDQDIRETKDYVL